MNKGLREAKGLGAKMEPLERRAKSLQVARVKWAQWVPPVCGVRLERPDRGVPAWRVLPDRLALQVRRGRKAP